MQVSRERPFTQVLIHPPPRFNTQRHSITLANRGNAQGPPKTNPGMLNLNLWRKIMSYFREPKRIRVALLSVMCLALLAIPMAKRAGAAHEHEGDAI